MLIIRRDEGKIPWEDGLASTGETHFALPRQNIDLMFPIMGVVGTAAPLTCSEFAPSEGGCVVLWADKDTFLYMKDLLPIVINMGSMWLL